MKSKSEIRELPASVANMIAAGEVVERPANVVKELIENALDAGAHHIAIAIEGAGTKLISVRDDGRGMSREDAELCIRPHATSKIENAEDLTSICSFGFRGEALPSIASVSRFRLMTSCGGEEGTEVLVDCGGEPKAWAAGVPRGTLVEVRDLFCNQPVRLKFLKTQTTEEGVIRKTVNTYALSNSNVGFSMTIDGRNVLQLRRFDTFKERLQSLVGKDFFSELVHVDAQDGEWRLSGYVQAPCTRDQIRHEQYFFVNGRPATAPVVQSVLRDTLADGNSKGGRPFVCLRFCLPNREVDVNVHPAKREVRFRKTTKVHQFIGWGIARSLNSVNEVEVPESTRLDPTLSENPMEPIGPVIEIVPDLQIKLPEPQFRFEAPANLPDKKGPIVPSIHVIGQMANGFVLAENERGLMVIDPNAACERITYEKLLGGMFAVQPLLMPQIVDIPLAENHALVSAQEELKKLGFEIDELSTGKWKVDAIPSLVKNPDLRDLLLEMASTISTDAKDLLAERVARKVAKFCGRSMPHGTREMMQALVNELSRTSQPYVRPSDKSATILFFSFNELGRKLGH